MRALALLHGHLLAGGVDQLCAGLALVALIRLSLCLALLFRTNKDTLALSALHLGAGRLGDGDAGLFGLWVASSLHCLQTGLLLYGKTALSRLADTRPQR